MPGRPSKQGCATMNRIKIYLDTSVISALFDDRTPERKAMTIAAWDKLVANDVYISDVVLDEVKMSSQPLRERMLKCSQGFSLLPVNNSAIELAQRYVLQGIFPESYFDDALHVAIASVHGIGYVLSWNFKHLVKVKTRRMVALANTLAEYGPVEIVAPPEL